MPASSDTSRLLYKLARAYYEDNLTQKQIGKRFGISRIKVSRLLKQARQQRVVQILLFPGGHPNAELEHQLEQKYNISEVVAVPILTDTRESITRTLGPVAADLLHRSLQGNEIIGLTWGSTLLAVVDALPAAYFPGIRIVQILGGLAHPDSSINGVDLARRMAQTLSGRPLLLPAPGIVQSKEVRDSLLSDVQIASVLTTGAKANIALVGLGVPTPDSVIRTSHVLSEEDIERLLSKGAIGDINLRFFDQNGERIEDKINDRIIGLDLDQIRKISRVIAVAGGSEKIPAIRAALKGKYLDVLVTDEITARALLE